MAYSLRKDPGTFTPYTDDNENSRRTVGRVATTFNVSVSSGTTTNETQTLQFSHRARNLLATEYNVYTEIESALVRFPNTQRERKQDEVYDLTKTFTSATGRVYSQEAADKLIVYTRANVDELIDYKGNTVTEKDQVGIESFSVSTDIPFLPAPGKIMNQNVASAKLISPDETEYNYIEIENTESLIGSATAIDNKFSFSLWFYLNSEKETILLSKGDVTSTTQECELKINEDMNLEFKIIDASTNEHIITSSKSVSANKWQHVVLSSIGNDWSATGASTNKFYKLYINKTIDKNYFITTSTYTIAGSPLGNEHIYVGTNIDSEDDNFDGLIAEVAIWKDYYLKKKEVVAIYDSSTKSRIAMDTREIDYFRQGVNVATDKQKYTPLAYKLSSNTQRNLGRPDHYVEQREFGQTLNYEGNVPFNDIEGRYTPYDLTTNMLLDSDTVQYPIVYENNIIEPIRNNGILEPLAIRETVLNNSADSPWQAHKISGEISGANTSPEFGTILITNDIKRNEDQLKLGNIMLNADCYFDSSEQSFDPVTNSAFTDASDSVYLRTLEKITFPVPGFSSDVPQTEVLFDDTVDITTNELINETEVTSGKQMALPDSFRSNHTIKSAPSGFTYDNNFEGTDSLAFGGLLRK